MWFIVACKEWTQLPMESQADRAASKKAAIRALLGDMHRVPLDKDGQIVGETEDVMGRVKGGMRGRGLDDKETPSKRKYTKSPFFPETPLRMMFFGGTGTGKTYTLLNTLLYSDNSPWDRVIWIAPEFSLNQPSLEEAQKKLKKRLVRLPGDTQLGIVSPHAEKLEELIAKGHEKKLEQLVVFDDLMTSKSPLLTNLFTSGRHRGVSVAVLNQRIFTGTGGDRTRRLNADWFFLFHLGGTGEVATLAQQLDRENFKLVTAAYKKAVIGRPLGSYLLIDQRAKRNTNAKLRALAYRDSSLRRVFPGLAET